MSFAVPIPTSVVLIPPTNPTHLADVTSLLGQATAVNSAINAAQVDSIYLVPMSNY